MDKEPLFYQMRPVKPGRYMARPWDNAPSREAVIEQVNGGLIMTKCGEKICTVPVDGMSQTIWWAGPL